MNNNPQLIDLISSFLEEASPPTQPINNVCKKFLTTRKSVDTDHAEIDENSDHEVDEREKLLLFKSTSTNNNNNSKPYHLHDDNTPTIEKYSAQVVLFSKDRPWQLQQLLRSMQLLLHDNNSPAGCSSTTTSYEHACSDDNDNKHTHTQQPPIITHVAEVVISIIVKKTSSFEAAYDALESEYGGTMYHHNHNADTSITVEFLEETDDRPFDQIIQTLLLLTTNTAASSTTTNAEHANNNDDDDKKHTDDTLVLFLTDDCVLLEPLSTILHAACSALFLRNDDDGNSNRNSNRNDPKVKVFGYLTRLHPGINYCQTADTACLRPTALLYNNHHHAHRTRRSSATNMNIGYYVYDRRATAAGGGGDDWSYAFDLSGGAYRASDVSLLIQELQRYETSSNSSTTTSSTSSCKHEYEQQQLSYLQHPNRLEVGGNRYCCALEARGRSSMLLLACPDHLTLVILAINRVQNVYHAPLALISDDDEVDEESSMYDTMTLLKWFERGDVHLDVESYYRHSAFHSSHIGQVILIPPPTNDEACIPTWLLSKTKKKHNKPAMHAASSSLSVLLPIHKGPPEHVAHAMTSVLMQPLQDEAGGGQINCNNANANLIRYMQIVIVDDRCRDGSINCAIETCDSVAQDYYYDSALKLNSGSLPHRRCRRLFLCVQDKRKQRATTISRDSENNPVSIEIASSVGTCNADDHVPMIHVVQYEQEMDPVTIDVVIVENAGPQGVASALNFGLQHCTEEYVARMDADDVCAPGRFHTQLSAFGLVEDPSTCVVLASSAHLFVAEPNNSNNNDFDFTLPYSKSANHHYQSSSRILRSSLSPCEPALIAWTMLFSCTVCHPSVLFRKSAIIQAGGYNTDIDFAHVEDYDLWLRLTESNCRSIRGIPQVGLYHRKHGSKDASRGPKAEVQRSNALNAAHAAMSLLITENRGCDNLAHCTLESAAILRQADTIDMLEASNDNDMSADFMNHAVLLIVELEEAFLHKHDLSSSLRVRKMIRADCNARIGAICSWLLRRFGRRAVVAEDGPGREAWQLWCDRCPNMEVERLSLLCRARDC